MLDHAFEGNCIQYQVSSFFFSIHLWWIQLPITFISRNHNYVMTFFDDCFIGSIHFIPVFFFDHFIISSFKRAGKIPILYWRRVKLILKRIHFPMIEFPWSSNQTLFLLPCVNNRRWYINDQATMCASSRTVRRVRANRSRWWANKRKARKESSLNCVSTCLLVSTASAVKTSSTRSK